MGKKRVPISLRKPPSPEALESFVQEGSPAEPVSEPAKAATLEASERVVAPAPEATDTTLAFTPEPVNAPEPEVMVMPQAPDRQGVFVAEDGRAMRPITIYLPVLLADRLGHHCLELDRNVSRVVTEALEAHLKRRLGPATSWSDERATEASPPRKAPPVASAGVRAWIEGQVAYARVERWLELGRTFLTGLRSRAEPA